MSKKLFLLLVLWSTKLSTNAEPIEDDKPGDEAISITSLPRPKRDATTIMSMFSPAMLTEGVLHAIVTAVSLIRDTHEIINDEDLLSEVEALHDALVSISTTIGNSMQDLINSANESRYKEMVLLVAFYTDFALSDGADFQQKMQSKRQLLKMSMKRWDNSTEKASKIDFNYDLFLRNKVVL